ncbi:MAG: hypothetical protein H8E44_28330 [Planctomycetes bacterium]|nr:hypothetical protein [Planctomycetota bacterium]MBL7041579.1 hypothetical protein [Pirellulaceae bacterium]
MAGQDINDAVAKALVEHNLVHFEECAALAEKVESPNAEDTSVIKCGIVAFSMITDPGNWTQDEFEFVKSRLDDTPQQMPEDGVKLKAMCLGAMCALRLEGKMEDQEFALADAQLPSLLLQIAEPNDSE